MKVEQLKVTAITQRANHRAHYKESDMSALMSSMRVSGLLQPIGVWVSSNGVRECIFGNSRLIAAKKLNWPTIPAAVFNAKTRQEAVIMNLTENVFRKNTSLGEEGAALVALQSEGLSISEICAKTGMAKRRVSDAIEAFNRIPKEFHHKVSMDKQAGKRKEGNLSLGLAAQALSLRAQHSLSISEFKKLLKYSTEDGVSEKQLRQMAPYLANGMSVQEASAVIGKYRFVTVTVMMSKKVIASIEKKNKTKIGKLLSQRLAGFSDLHLGKEK